MDKVLKIGIIGCGAIGKDHCRRIIETVPGATVVAVSDYVAAAADETAAKYGIKSYGNDCDGMIKDPEVEAVVITSIDPTHHDYVMKTLAEEKWCFCEKPLSQNAKDCEEIINRELEIGKRLGLDHPEVISKEVLQEAEGTRIEMKGKLTFDVDPTKLEVPPEPHHLSDAVLYKEFEEHPMVVVCGTVGEDEHSVGLREIINIKHGGIEKWGVKVHYLGTSVPVEKLVDAAVELNANAILASTIISHDNVHYKNMKRINELAVEKGIRDRVIIAAGGTQVIPDEAVKTGIDQGFGRDSHGIDVATFLAEEAMRRRGEL